MKFLALSIALLSTLATTPAFADALDQALENVQASPEPAPETAPLPRRDPSVAGTLGSRSPAEPPSVTLGGRAHSCTVIVTEGSFTPTRHGRTHRHNGRHHASR